MVGDSTFLLSHVETAQLQDVEMDFPALYDCHWLLLFSLILIGFRKIWTQIQLADEKSTIKALRKRQEKDREEMEKLNTDLNV